MVAGHLREVRGFYHIVLSYTRIDEKRPPDGRALGAADGTRTRTVLLPGDFKSLISQRN
jgi:hypothetical protein